MKSRLILSFAVQSIGPGSLFALSFIIAHRYGAAAQGSFNSSKAWLDLLISLGCFGLPQSIIYEINRYRGDRLIIHKAVLNYAVLLIPVFVLITLVTNPTLDFLASNQSTQGSASGERARDLLISLLYGGAAGLMVYCSLQRAILLTLDDGLRFAIYTIVPAVSLTLIYGAALPLGIQAGPAHAALFALSSLLCLLTSWRLFPRTFKAEGNVARPIYRRMAVSGFDIFIQSVTITAQVLLSYRILGKFGSASLVGNFGMAVLILQLFSLPLQTISPIFTNRWSRRIKPLIDRQEWRSLRWIVFSVLAISILSWFVISGLIPKVFGSQFQTAGAAAQLLSLSFWPSFVSKIATLYLAASGDYRYPSIVSVIRLILAVAPAYVFAYWEAGEVTPELLALCWLAAELVGFPLLFWRFVCVYRLV